MPLWWNLLKLLTDRLHFVLGNPGSANDLVAKLLSLSPTVHHYKTAECELVERVATSAKLFMDDLPRDGTISIEEALGILNSTQTNFYCGAGFKLEPEWHNNLFYKHNGNYRPLNGIRKLVAGNYGVNTYRNRKHTDIWPDHYERWPESLTGIHNILEDSCDHLGNPSRFDQPYVFAEYGNFHWFRQAFPECKMIMPQWRNQSHFAFYYHLRQFGNADETENLGNRDSDNIKNENVGYADELIQRFYAVTDTELEEPLLRSILFKHPHYIPQYLMLNHATGVDRLLRDPMQLKKLFRTSLRRSMYFSMRKEDMMRHDVEHDFLVVYNDDFFNNTEYRNSIFDQLGFELPEDTVKFMQSIQTVMQKAETATPAPLPKEWVELHTKPVNNQELERAVIDMFAQYCDHQIEIEPGTALDDIKRYAPGRNAVNWTRADELAIELGLVLNGTFDDIEQTNVGEWRDCFTVSEFIHLLEQHLA